MKDEKFVFLIKETSTRRDLKWHFYEKFKTRSSSAKLDSFELSRTDASRRNERGASISTFDVVANVRDLWTSLSADSSGGITNSLERIHPTNSFKENVLFHPASGRNPRIDKGSSLSFSAFRTWNERSSNSNEACSFRKERVRFNYLLSTNGLLFESSEIQRFITKL